MCDLNHMILKQEKTCKIYYGVLKNTRKCVMTHYPGYNMRCMNCVIMINGVWTRPVLLFISTKTKVGLIHSVTATPVHITGCMGTCLVLVLVTALP